MKTITEFLSEKAITENQRFNFRIPESVASDLLFCYQYVVKLSERKFEMNEATQRVLQSTVNWLEKGKRGLMLYGNYGTGKSRLMEALNYLFHYYENRQNYLRITSATQLVELSMAKTEKDIHGYNMLKTAKYVGIDDVGTEPASVKDWGTERSPLIDILYYRYNTQKTTIVSTNLDMDMIRKTYGERISDRMYEMYDRICFNFKSFRQ